MNKRISLHGFIVVILSAIFFGCIYYLGFETHQKDFIGIIIPYATGFCIYLLLLYKFDLSNYFYWLLGLGVVCRVLLIFSFPNLSDDIYRFLWDAQLILDGQNPYLLLPENIVNVANQELYDNLNSQSYYSPYPPVAQLIYTVAAYLGSSDLQIFSLVIKLFTFLAEIATLYLIINTLKLLKLNRSRVLIYALNPLIIIELVGNLHFESFMVLFMIAAIYYLIRSDLNRSALSFTLAIASKLLPLMFTPALLAYLGIKKSIKYLSLVGFCLAICFVPIIIGILNGAFLSSVGLYFQKFEFNASIYYLLREIGFLIYGWNIINTLGPALAMVTLLSICGIWYRFRYVIDRDHIFLFLLFSISIYLFFGTTIHPWYVALPLAFCLFTEFRFPVIWSGLIFFTYYNYSTTPYQENLWIVALEYMIVFCILILELRKYQTKKASLN